MPKGRSKGFGHYMNKKFFHPSNPENLERVYIAKQKVALKEKMEREKLQEYEKEQALWENRAAISKHDKDRMALSFMYDPPAGHRPTQPPQSSTQASGSGSTQDKNPAKPDKKDDFKFEWQRNAPRLAHAKDDPNIIDQPFGIEVQFTKCMKCQIWGHQHTDKKCPRYGKSNDDISDEPVRYIDEKQLISEMKAKERLEFTSYGAWDNGKVAKHYDLVYSDEEGNNHSDIMFKLLQDMRAKEKKVAELRRKVEAASSSNRKSAKRKKKKSANSRKKVNKHKLSKSRSPLTPPPNPKKKKSSSFSVKRKSLTPQRKSLTPQRNSPKSKYVRKEDRSSSDQSFEESSESCPSSDSEVTSSSETSDTEDSISEEENEEISEETRREYLSKLDDILFSDINTKPTTTTSPQPQDSPTEKSGKPEPEISVPSTSHRKSPEESKNNLGKQYLSEVDKILGISPSESLGAKGESIDQRCDKTSAEKAAAESDKTQLTESEMRLFNLIGINKIDVKKNFPDAYHGDTSCHFCRKEESQEHLSVCPVYDEFMHGSEFKDIKSKNVKKVKRALKNIRKALHTRSKALSFTSIGPISQANMQLLDVTANPKELDETSKKIIQIIDNQKFKIC
eukprot:TRINITY_DN7772_c0_g1_i4.p1 TRINITY_DN7772_c0_g1~~TRINITY_DN7772_c0_g1_i4.p1  ORF type:complete len:621 (+),score=150.33 TRINITY_DN7772_c0_g1_i4:62-1924(+)